MFVPRVWSTGIVMAGLLLSACAPAAAPSPTAAPAKPAEAKPTEAAKPAESKPAESKPAEAAKPAGSPAAAPAAAPAKPANLTKITIGHGAVSATDTPWWVAADQGIYAKNGLEVEDVTLTGGSQVSQALSSGSVPIASGGLGALMDAKLSGIELMVLGSPYPWQFFQIYAQPQYKTMEDLRGKTIAASDPGSSSDRALIQVGQKYNMVPGKDFNVTYVGGTKERVQVLEQKVADASIISPPNGYLAGKQGFTKVVDLIADKIPFGYSGMAANSKWAAQNPQLLDAVLKSYLEGLAIAKANPEIAKQSISKYTQIKDQDVLDEAYNVSVKVMPLIPASDVELVKLMLALSEQPTAKSADPASLIDTTAWKRIQESGFLKTLPVQQ